MASPNSKRISLTIAKDFRALQEERVQQYKVLSEAHKEYLASAPDYKIDPYQTVVNNVTQQFKKISELILDLQARAESDVCRDKTLANIIRKVQLLEEQKLHRTVDVQLAQQQSQDNPDDDLMKSNVRGIQARIQELIENINETFDELKYYQEEIRQELEDVSQ